MKTQQIGSLHMAKQFTIMKPSTWRDMDYIAVKGIKLVTSIDWDLIAPHEAQADKNHSQSLAELQSRGGLSACEAVAVLEDRPWHRMTLDASYARLSEIVNQQLTK